MSFLNRRTFIKSTAAVSAMAVPAISYARIAGANEQLRFAAIGFNGQGKTHINQLKQHIVALCDADKNILGNMASNLKKEDKEVKTYVDYRELMDDKSIDIVSIATPNHLHAIIAIAAVVSGKDVYVEKPVSHNVWEGRQLVNAARKYKRIVQCGTQSRSSHGIRQAVQYVRDGKLGDIQYAIGTCYKPRKSIGKLDKPLVIPSHVDYEMWCGPAEKRDLYRPRLHYDWHWDFNTGNGDMGNQGIHQMDIARWFLGYNELSPRIISIGGRLGYDDAGDTPNTQTVLHDYQPAPLIFETRGLPKAKKFQSDGWGGNMDNYRGSRVGVIVQCKDGYVVIPNYNQATIFDNDGQQITQFSGSDNHYENFLKAVRSRNPQDLNAEILEGHLSSALCHTGSISHLLGQVVSAEDIRESIAGHKWFSDSIERMLEHLKANEVEGDVVLGATLEMDAAAETCLGSDAANDLLSRDYRKPFVVEQVN